RDKEAKQALLVVADPALGNTDADWQAREAAVVRSGELQNAVADAIARISAAKDDVKVVLAKLDARKKEQERAAGGAGATKAADDPDKPLAQAARDLQKKLSAMERRLYVPPDTRGIVEDETAFTKVSDASRAFDASWGRPTPTMMTKLEEAETQVKAALADFNKLFSEDVAAFRQKVAEAKIDLLAEQPPIEVK